MMDWINFEPVKYIEKKLEGITVDDKEAILNLNGEYLNQIEMKKNDFNSSEFYKTANFNVRNYVFNTTNNYIKVISN